MKPDREILITQHVLLPMEKKPEPASLIKRCYQGIGFYRRQYRTRRQLRRLSDAQLRDVGITAQQAQVESKKFFWQK